MVFAHRHRDARSDPRHRTDRRNEAETDERTDNSPAVGAENVFSRNQANLDSAAHFLHRCGHEEDRIEKDVSCHHNESASKKRAWHIPLRLLYFADDVGRGIPARVRIHDINEGDREGAAEDRPRVAGLRQKSDRLFLFDEKSSSDEHANQKQLHHCPKILKGAAKAQVTEMEKRHDPNEHERKDNR